MVGGGGNVMKRCLELKKKFQPLSGSCDCHDIT